MSENVTITISQHKRKAELLFCGCVLSNPDSAKHECGWLKPEIFTDKRMGNFWKSVIDGEQPTEAAINNQIMGELLGVQSEIISSMQYASFANVIADDHYLIDVSEQLPQIAKAVGERDQSQIKKLVMELSEQGSVTDTKIPTAYEIALSFAETVGVDNKSIKTNIAPYDSVMGGYIRGTLNLIAARPSMGKTSLAWQIARNMAASGYKTIYFSIEMTSTALWARAACGVLEYSVKDYYNNKLTHDQITKLIDVSSDLMNAYGDNLMIDDRAKLSSDDIWKAVARYQPDCIVVDHISLLADKAENEVKRLGLITWSGKQIAKEYNLVSIYLQQLNRGTETRGKNERRPTMSDLRDSGETEQNADTVTFIYREDYYEIDKPPMASDTELIVAKNREGVRNVIAVTKYHLKRQWFYSKMELEQEIENRRTS